MAKSGFFLKSAGVYVLIFALPVLFSVCTSQSSAMSDGNAPEPFSTAADAIGAFRNARPGTHIVIKDGTYVDFDLNFGSRSGAENRNIVIRAQTPGGVTLTGKSRIYINNCSYVTISGFIFKDGFYGAGTSNAGILVSNDASHHIRITDILMDGYHSPTPEDDCRWVRVYGQYNEVDNCTFINKGSKGVTVEICRSNTEPNFALVHHNFFGFSRPLLDSEGREVNGLETFRIGTSERSQYDASCVCEYNFFEECDGEIEIISNKSGNNTYRGNVMFNCNGTLSLRHGSGCTVEDSFFINVDKPGMGGVRVMDKNHIVRNNYFENLRTNRRSAVSLEYAVPNSPLNRYWPVINTVIENNTFVDNRIAIALGPPGGISSDQTIPPVGTAAKNNLIVSNTGTLQIAYRASTDPAVKFTNTVAYGPNLQLVGHGTQPVNSPAAPAGITIADPQMTKNEDGLFMPGEAFKKYGIQLTRGKTMLKREDTGASFARGGRPQ